MWRKIYIIFSKTDDELALCVYVVFIIVTLPTASQ